MPQAIRVPRRLRELLPTPGAAGTIPVSQGAGLDPVWQAVAGLTVAYEHSQAIPSAEWVIAHNLGFRPNVTVIDTLGRTVEGDIAYADLNTLTLSFSAGFAGTAYLS